MQGILQKSRLSYCSIERGLSQHWVGVVASGLFQFPCVLFRGIAE